MGSELWGIELAQSWAEAFAAVGTVAAFAVAAAVFWRNRADRRDDEANQARLIYRKRSTQRAIYWNSVIGKNVAERQIDFEIVNHSPSPIHAITGPRVRRNGVWEDTRPREMAPTIETLRSGDEITIAVVRLSDLDPELDELFDLDPWDIEFRFTDASGREWTRRSQEQPARVTPPGRLRRLRSAVTGLRPRRQGR